MVVVVGMATEEVLAAMAMVEEEVMVLVVTGKVEVEPLVGSKGEREARMLNVPPPAPLQPPPAPIPVLATAEWVQANGLPPFLVGQNTQALQTLVASPGLINAFGNDQA